jgi:hypothetical protein
MSLGRPGVGLWIRRRIACCEFSNKIPVPIVDLDFALRAIESQIHQAQGINE